MLLEIALLLYALNGVNGRLVGNLARTIDPETAANNSYDFIIVGGGLSGLTVADRLTEDPLVSVLVIEFGPLDKGEDSILVPGAYNPVPYLWPNLISTPQAGLLNKTFSVPLGRVVGGGSTVNGMIFRRGVIDDFAGWEKLGNPGWNWDGLLPYFKKSEKFARPDPDFQKEHHISWDDSVHGFNGPIHCSYSPFDYAPSKNFWNATLDSGIREGKDANNGKAVGIFWLLRVLNPDTQTRSYAKIEHYDRFIGTRPNYHLIPEHAVSKILFRQKQAVGVEFITRATGELRQAFAKKEVIVSAGGVHSPQILQLSGIGPKPLLEGLGIDVIVDLPGVGQNFHDQPGLAINYNFSKNLYPNEATLVTNTTYDNEQQALYLSSQRGAWTLTRGEGTNIALLPLRNITTSQTLNRILKQTNSVPASSALPPNTHPSVLAGYLAQRKLLLSQFSSPNSPIGSISWNTGSTSTIYMAKPLSRGSIYINSTHPLANPVINFNTFKDPTDLDLVLALFMKNRDIFSQPSMQGLGPVELGLATGVKDPEALKEVLRTMINPSNAHECCTNAMMKRELGGVVDSELRVYGVKGLSVVDISIFPFTVAGAPSATLYGAAEKAADIIKKRHGMAGS